MAFDPVKFASFLPADSWSQRPDQQASLPPLTEEEKQSLLDSIGSGALHGLGYLGGSLSKAFGGRAIRGLIGGRPEELASIIPFSDTLGITDPAHEVTGAELLGGNKDTSLFSPEGIGGLGLDIALDPSTWFGGAIVKGLGKGAQLAGRGLTNLPKVGPGIEAFGQGARSLYQRTIPPLFQGSVMGVTEPAIQQTARNATAAIPVAEAAARESVQPFKDAFLQAAGHTGGEITPQVAQNLDYLGREFKMVREGRQGPSRFPGVNQLVSDYGGITDASANEAVRLGLMDTLPQSQLPYLRRQATAEAVVNEFTDAGGKRLVPTSVKGREKIVMEPRQIPVEGPGSLNDLSMRDNLPHSTPLAARDIVAREYLGVQPQEFRELTNLRNLAQTTTLTPAQGARLAELEAVMKQAQGLAEWNSTFNHAAIKQAGGMFPNHPIADLEGLLIKQASQFPKAAGVHEAIAKLAVPATQLQDGIPLSRVLIDAGMGAGDIHRPGAMFETFKALIREGKLPPNALLGMAENFVVPKEAAASVAKFIKASSTPEGLKPFLNIWDSITNLTKSFQTTLWPATKARNQAQAMFQGWVHDAFDPNVTNPAMKYIKPWLDAKAWREGRTIEGLSQIPEYAAKGMDDVAATKALANEVYNWNIPGRSRQEVQQVAGSTVPAAVKQMQFPGFPQKGFIETAKSAIPQSLEEAKLWKVKGVGGATEDVFSGVKAGREIDSALDDINRVSTYIAKRKQGLSPEASFREVIATHYDFSNLSDFEKSFMRRVIPFYGWLRQNVPAVVTELANNPGGKMAQGIRVANEAAGHEQGFTPDYLGSGIAAKIGGVSLEGRQTYLSSFGLPFEDLAQVASPSGFLGSMNPLLRAPLEMATNRQFFTGRELTGTVPHTGSMVGDQLLAASPLGRFSTTGRMILDPRTGWGQTAINLLSGARVTDVDQAAAQRNAIRQAAEQQLQSSGLAKQFNRVYVPKDQQANLTPRDRAALLLLQSR